MIEVKGLTMRYGRTVTVNDLTFTVKPGLVTGFLGPNGAGKSTTMRAVLGLETPTAGKTLVDGRPYASLRRPMHTMERCWTPTRCTAAARPLRGGCSSLAASGPALMIFMAPPRKIMHNIHYVPQR